MVDLLETALNVSQRVRVMTSGMWTLSGLPVDVGADYVLLNHDVSGRLTAVPFDRVEAVEFIDG